MWPVWLVALAVLLANHPGQIFFDTKLGVDIDPLGFYVRLWHLWNPLEWFGTLQDQYIGYAFPMAPFYLAGELLRCPVWITERLWLSLLIAVGFGGMVRLAAALRIGSARSRVMAGLLFALWPTFTILIGSTSAGILPGLLAPWAVLPLVEAGRGTPLIRAAARSGVVVLCMGGVNGTSTMEALALPAMFVLTQTPRGIRLRLGASWLVAVVLATSWWVVPLLLQGKYSFDFLPYTELAATTTGTMSAATFLRGSGNWTAYLDLGRPWLSAGWMMVTSPVAVLASALVAGLGLAGIARRDMPAGRWLRLSLGLAALAALSGYPGPLGGPFHVQLAQLLNASLAVFRNVYKLEPVAAAALALGIAHILAAAARRADAVAGGPARGAYLRLALVPVGVFLVAGLALPYLSGQVLNPGSFTAVPGYWYRLAAFLRTHSPQAPALVVPAEAHGTYLWGEPIDDPLESLATSPWVARSLVPYGGAGSDLLLNSLEGALTSGERVAGLPTLLARSGVRYVVVRNDLDPTQIGYTPPQLVHLTLASSGFRRVAAFGPLITGRQTDPGASPQIQALAPAYPAIEVYAADGAQGPGPPPVAVLPVSDTVLVNGGPDGLLQLIGQGILAGQPAVIAGDRLVTRPALWAVTDSLRRADHAFGLIDTNASYTYTATQTNPVDDPLGGGGSPPRQVLPVTAAGHQTVAVLSGAAAVTASSSGSWLAETPQIDPVNAFDGNPNTVWAEASPASPVGQWIAIRFSHSVELADSIRIRLLADSAARPVADRLRISTAAGTVTATVRPIGSEQSLRVPPGATRWLRITIAGVHGGIPGGPGAGFRDVLIPGVTVTAYLQPPEDRVGLRAPAVAFSFQQQLPSSDSLGDPGSYPPLARTFVTPVGATFRLGLAAVAIPGRSLMDLLSSLAPVKKDTFGVTATSTWRDLPSLAPAGLFRPRDPTPWIAGGPNPVLRLRWHGARRITQIIVGQLPTFAAAPEAVQITSRNGDRLARIGSFGLAQITPPLTTDQMSISFPFAQSVTSTDPVYGEAIQLPVGLSSLAVPALAGLHPALPGPGTRFRLACGGGPRISIDGKRYPTRVIGTVRDLTQFLPVQVQLCTPSSTLRLGQGRHWLMAAVPGSFAITDISLTSLNAPSAGVLAASGIPGAGTAGARRVRVTNWYPEHRQVSIGPGPAAYLELHQNANPGWVATLNGRTLVPVRLDGWQQGFVVPAGAGGVVDMTFSPVVFYHAWIVISVIGVLVLLAFALFGRGLLETPEAGAPPRAHAAAWLGLLALSGLIIAIGGPLAVAVPVLAVVSHRGPRWLSVIAFGAMAASGVLAAQSANGLSGAFGAPAQACAVIGLAAALTPVLPAWPVRTRWWHRPRVPS